MYPKEYFLDRFKDDETGVLFHRYATDKLTDEAKAAIVDLLVERGLPETELQALIARAGKDAYRVIQGNGRCDFCFKPAPAPAVFNAGQRFCSERCLRQARVSEISQDLTEAQVHAHACQIKQGPCPVCKRSRSRVEVRHYHRVWSYAWIARIETYPQVCCHACANKTNLGCVVFCMLFGWWGIGCVAVPGQVVANLIELFRAKSGPEPSDELLEFARTQLAKQLYRDRATEKQAA